MIPETSAMVFKAFNQQALCQEMVLGAEQPVERLGRCVLGSASERGRYMLCVQGSSRLGNLKARSPTAITRLLRTDASTFLFEHKLMSRVCLTAHFLGIHVGMCWPQVIGSTKSTTFIVYAYHGSLDIPAG